MSDQDMGANLGDAVRSRSYERRFARAFLQPDKRDRFIQVASAREHPPRLDPKGMKRRGKYRAMLANLEHWLAVGSTRRVGRPGLELTELLRAPGAPSECYCMSLSPTRDGEFLRLVDLVPTLSPGDNVATLVICCPESLAYYWHGECEDLSLVLSRDDGKAHECEIQLDALRRALTEGEERGVAGPLDMEKIKREAREQAGQAPP